MQKTTARDFDFENYELSFWAQHAWWMAPLAVFALTVVLTVMSFPAFRMAPFAYGFAAPAIFWAMTRPTFKKFAWVMLGAQAASWIIILSWLHHVTWIGMFLLGAFVGVWIGVWHLALWWTARHIHGKPLLVRAAGMFGLAGLWVVVEWTRSWFLTGFPWLPLGASQWTVTPLLQIASFTGQKGISFVLIVFNFGFAAYFHRLFNERHTGLRKRSPEFIIAILVLLVAVMPFLADLFRHNRLVGQEGEQRYVRVALVQPDIPQSVKWNPEYAGLSIKVLDELTMRAVPTAPELIIWPEAATPVPLKGWPESERMLKWVEGLAARAKTPLLIGAVASEDPKDPDNTLFNEAFVIDPERGVQPGSYQKRRLVPFGEYVPLRSLLGWLSTFTDVSTGDTQPGTSAMPLSVETRTGKVKAGMLICYEDIFPYLGVANMYAGAEIQVVLTNNAWFGEGSAAYQHAAHSVMGAVETRRPIIRCGNNGWSGWIDEYGNIRGVMTNPLTPPNSPSPAGATIYFRGTQTFDVMRDPEWAGRDSFYVRHGEWFVLVSGMLVFFGYCMAQFYKPRDTTPPTYAETVTGEIPKFHLGS